MSRIKSYYDTVILGSGHNALVAASYLARTGQSVLILEKRNKIGGATSSRKVFKGVDVNLSEYSYLLSLFPKKILKDLGLKINGKRRTYASYTPFYDDLTKTGLLISNTSEKSNKEAFSTFTGGKTEYKSYLKLLELEKIMAEKVWPTLLSPLMTRKDMKNKFKGKKAQLAWKMFIEQPLGKVIEKYLKSDPIRGLVFTDAKIGILTHPRDPSLIQNRTFLYHIIGNGTGEWQVPIGGMGGVAKQLEEKAEKEGAQIESEVEVVGLTSDPKNPTVKYRKNGKIYSVKARFVLANLAPTILAKILKTNPGLSKDDTQGTEFKINMVLTRLPKLKDPQHSAKKAICGTFHINEGYEHMKTSYLNALKGKFTENPPGEMYCQTLTDSSIVSPKLRKKGYQTLTLFGLDMPYKMFVKDNKGTKEKVLKKYLEAINKHLDEPIEDCIAKDENGRPCIEAKSPVDIERELGMPLGNIFHNELSWPFVENKKNSGEWGVEIGYPNIFLCGAGAKRGGCVSGIPGHNAAMKVLSLIKTS